jgi:hypothetical protein
MKSIISLKIADIRANRVPGTGRGPGRRPGREIQSEGAP